IPTRPRPGGNRMNRREFIALAGGVAAWSFVVRAQQPAIPVIGYFSSRSLDAEAPIRVPFLKALEGSGFATGHNIAIEYRFAEGQDERLPELAAELVRRQVAMLVATDRPPATAAKGATATIRIVFTSGFDPVQMGLAASFNRPGGNAAGVSLLTGELGPKRLALVRELLPKPDTIAFVVNKNSATTPFQWRPQRRPSSLPRPLSHLRSLRHVDRVDCSLGTLSKSEATPHSRA